MRTRLAVIAALFLATAAEAAPSPGKLLILSCYGPTFPDGYTQAEINKGAFNSWCYDPQGRRVARQHHGPVFDQLLTRSGTIEVTFTHYREDADDDDVLEPSEIDGELSLRFQVTLQSTARGMPALDLRNFVIALEVPASQITAKSGAFEDVEMVISRGCARYQPVVSLFGLSVGLKIVYNNFSSLTFLEAPVPLSL